MQSSNPAISVIGKTAGYNFGGTAEHTATIQGTTTKSIILIAVTLIIGYMAMNYSLGQLYYYGKAPTFLMGFSVIAAFIVSLEPVLALIAFAILVNNCVKVINRHLQSLG